MPFIAIALLVAAALGGGVSVAANNALPGDALWGFKTSINEGIQGSLAASDEARANWDISVLAARLDEAQKLTVEGTLDAEAQAELTANFDAHAQDIAARIEKLQSAGKADVAADIAARFQAAVAGHASAVAEASAQADASVQATVAPFMTKVRGTLDSATNLSSSASAQASANANGGATGSSNNGSSTTSGSSSSGAGTSGSVNASGALRVNTGSTGSASSSTSGNSSSGVNVNIY